MSVHLAVDIGGSHGRGVLGVCENSRWTLTEVGQFSTAPIEIDGTLCWNLAGMLQGIGKILRNAGEHASHIDTLAIDTMGLAFGLLDRSGALVTPPVYTRSPQEEGLKREIIDHIGREKLYGINGLEQNKLNTLYYLAKLRRDNPHVLEKAVHGLMLPDLLNFMLTGKMRSEYTIAATSGLWDMGQRQWSRALFSDLGLEETLFPPAEQCGEPVGPLKPEWRLSPSLNACLVVHAAAHDTASALYALPAEDREQLFLSAGTWCMLGCPMEKPLLTKEALDAGFANEGAADGGVKLLYNMPGMSVLAGCAEERCRSDRGPKWDQIFKEAEDAVSTGALIDLQHPAFRAQSGIPERIRQYCRETGQPVPASAGELTLCVVESIATRFAAAHRRLSDLTGKRFRRAVMVGGGGRSPLFVRKCEEALEIPVSVFSSEASILGNLKAQMDSFK